MKTLREFLNEGTTAGEEKKPFTISKETFEKTNSKVQTDHYHKLNAILQRHGQSFTHFEHGHVKQSDGFGKSAVARSHIAASRNLVWHKKDSSHTGAGQNHVIVGGKRHQLSSFLNMSYKEQDHLLSSGHTTNVGADKITQGAAKSNRLHTLGTHTLEKPSVDAHKRAAKAAVAVKKKKDPGFYAPVSIGYTPSPSRIARGHQSDIEDHLSSLGFHDRGGGKWAHPDHRTEVHIKKT